MKSGAFKRSKQYLVSITSVILLSSVCFLLKEYIDYQIVALLLLLMVSILSIVYDIIPVTIAALLSAFILNIFFIDPLFHYKINNAENALLFFIYLLMALVSAILTDRIRKQEKKIREKEEKEKTIKLYNTLLNSLSHELRTPISTIIGAIDMLKEHDTLISPDYKNILLVEMEIASMRLNRQVENLLNMNRLETENLRLKKDWCDVNELIFLVIQKFPDLKTHQIIFKPEEAFPLFKIDAGLMEQVLYGLIHNAILYTEINTIICIELMEDKEHLEIIIWDNGIGFPEDKKEMVFEKFYRLPHSKTGGTGLGLSIAKGFVEAHNGTIVLKNLPQGGAHFTIRIPSEVSYLKNLKNE